MNLFSRNWCTSRTATAPLADGRATRFTEPLRTSPTANTAARADSYVEGRQLPAPSSPSGVAGIMSGCVAMGWAPSSVSFRTTTERDRMTKKLH